MRKVLLLCLVLYSGFVCGQKQNAREEFEQIADEWKLDEHGNVSFTKMVDVPGASKEELYTRALSYFTYNYKSANDVVQVKDKEQGVVVGKGIYSPVFVGGSIVLFEYDATHILRIDVKDGRVRIIVSVTEFRMKASGGNSLPTYTNFPVSQRFPFLKKDTAKKQMCKVICRTYSRVMGTLAEVEKSMKDGNTAGKIENADW